MRREKPGGRWEKGGMRRKVVGGRNEEEGGRVESELGRRERFRVFAHLTRRHFDDAMREDATVLEKTRTRKTRRVTDANFRVF